MKHKWHDEIVAWAAGAEIEYWNKKLERWIIVIGMPLWNSEAEFRVYSEYMKPQPKEPKYLYAYKDSLGRIAVTDDDNTPTGWKFFGKIEVQDDD